MISKAPLHVCARTAIEFVTYCVINISATNGKTKQFITANCLVVWDVTPCLRLGNHRCVFALLNTFILKCKPV